MDKDVPQTWLLFDVLQAKTAESRQQSTRNFDLTRSEQPDRWTATAKPQVVWKVGGIHANNMFPADFISDSLAISHDVIRSAYEYGVDRLMLSAPGTQRRR